jgi:hypothetical protein
MILSYLSLINPYVLSQSGRVHTFKPTINSLSSFLLSKKIFLSKRTKPYKSWFGFHKNTGDSDKKTSDSILK